MKAQEEYLVSQTAVFIRKYVENKLSLAEYKIQVITDYSLGSNDTGFRIFLVGHKIPLDCIFIDRSNFQQGPPQYKEILGSV